MTTIAVKAPYTTEQVNTWLRGLLTIAWADGDFDPDEQNLIATLSHDQFDSDADVNGFEPITPEELATVLGQDPSMAENFLRTGVMLALADGIYSVSEDDILHKFCAALGLQVKALDALRHNLAMAKLQAEADPLSDLAAQKAASEHHPDLLSPVKHWLDAWEIHDPKVAHAVCKMVPPQCPFERDIFIFGKKVAHIPAMCKLNPLYDQLVGLRFRALSYLADECKEDITNYIS